ncbi:thioredoxin domain-containing protein [Halomicronema hongdechloris C2206]|uniref:Thioredoxin domain-containing protein n=2 Tax=Halomicronema hongdechloris TaxID=1209493 RepID=A0A1Z3HP83_9CYAN|nr:thioredoxin domain-containing protein [Halomicronema hongdechloris C2206]
MISPVLEHFQSEWHDYIRLIDINADENLKLANFYRLTTLPTLMFFDHGHLYQRLDTFRGKDDLRMVLDAFMRSREMEGYIANLTPIYPYTRGRSD